MIEPLLELPAHVRERLVNALKTGLLVAPYEDAAVRSALGGDAAAAGVRDALRWLNDRGIPGPAVALALEAASRAVADTRASGSCLVRPRGSGSACTGHPPRV